jgi:hypothetical protein
MAAFLMNWKSTVIVSGAGLVATVFGWVSTPIVPQRASAPVTTPATQSAQIAAAADIQQEAARLQSRLVPNATFRQPSRNPFQFGPRPTARSSRPAPTQVQEALVPIAPVVPRPNIQLRGIATDTVDGALQRTAIMTTDAGLLLVREGESAGAYRVSKIEDEAVELTGPDGLLRLTLSTPNSQLPTPK